MTILPCVVFVGEAPVREQIVGDGGNLPGGASVLQIPVGVGLLKGSCVHGGQAAQAVVAVGQGLTRGGLHGTEVAVPGIVGISLRVAVSAQLPALGTEAVIVVVAIEVDGKVKLYL